MTEMIGRLVKQRRLELDMTIRELGRRTGLSASFISQLEREKVNVSYISMAVIWCSSRAPQKMRMQSGFR